MGPLLEGSCGSQDLRRVPVEHFVGRTHSGAIGAMRGRVVVARAGFAGEEQTIVVGAASSARDRYIRRLPMNMNRARKDRAATETRTSA